LRPVVDEHDADALVSVGDEVFGADHAAIGRHILAGVAQSPPTIEAVVAWARITPVSAARVECNAGTDFAGLSGGGTLPSCARPWRVPLTRRPPRGIGGGTRIPLPASRCLL